MTAFSIVYAYLKAAGRTHLFRVKKCDGQPAVTFEVVDSWHQSSIGTAWHFFVDRRKRFNADDTIEWGGETFLTERGYSKIAVRCFDDLLSWKVHERMLQTGMDAAPDPSGGEWPEVPDSLPDDLE